MERHDDSPTDAARRVLQTIPAVFRLRTGVAPSTFAASVAAGMTAPGSITTVTPANLRAFLSITSVTWLPLPNDTIHFGQFGGVGDGRLEGR